jgi:threonine/homoserine/homoserine lactone efflux protein
MLLETMSLETWLAFCVTETFLCLTPGPAVLFVVSVALARGTRPGLAAAFGILAGNALYFALSATGVAAVIVASHEVFTILKWAGAAYLIWIGVRMILTKRLVTPVEGDRVRRAFRRGFIVQTANPKTLLFFAALLPQFLDARGDVAVQVTILAVSSVVIELTVLSVYVAAAVRARKLASANFATPIERIGGTLLVAAGARLALTGVT